MPQVNMKITDDQKTKLEWLSDVAGDSEASVVRNLIEQAYDEKKAVHQSDLDFIRWIRQNRNA